MSDSVFSFTDEARPVVQIGLGDTRVPTGTGVWDTALWDNAAAQWGGIDPAFLDVSCYCHEAEFTSGRERFIDRFQPGTASVTLRNDDGWADLAGTPGQIAALSLRPGRAVRIGVELASLGVCWMWRGVIDAVTPDYDPVAHDVVTIDCIDSLGDVGSTKLAELAPSGADEFVHERIARILDACKWEPLKRVLGTSSVKLIATTMGAQAIDLLGVSADSGSGVVCSDTEGNILFRPSGWQTWSPAYPPSGGIGNVDKGLPGVPPTDHPSYFSTPPATDVSTPDGVSIALPNAFVVFAESSMPVGTTGQTKFLVGQMDGTNREWLIARDIDGTWSFGTSTDGTSTPPTVPFTSIGATPPTGSLERVALAVMQDDGIGQTLAALTPAFGYASTADAADLVAPTTLYVTAFLRCDDVDAAGSHVITGQSDVSPNLSWTLRLTAGVLEFVVSANGTTAFTYQVASAAEVAAVFADGTDQFIGASIQFTTTPGNARVAMLTSFNGANWLERYARAITSAVGQPFNTTARLAVGARSDATQTWNGRIYWAQAHGNGTAEANRIWRFDAHDNDANPDPDGLSYIDPRGRSWILSAAGSIDETANYQTTALRLFQPNPYPSGPRWVGLEAPQRLPRMLRTDRSSPLRIGRFSGGTGQEWEGRIYSVELAEGQNPNLPGQTIWRMDPDEQRATAYLDASIGIASTPDVAIPASFHILVHARKTAKPSGVIAALFSQAGSNQFSIAHVIAAAGANALLYSSTGVSYDGQKGVNGSPTAGVDSWFGFLLDRPGGATHTYNGLSSTDGVTWTNVGGGGTIASAFTFFDSSAAIQIGAINTIANKWDGRIYSVEMRTGVVPGAGTVVWKFDANEYPGTGTSYVDPRGRTWTLTAATAIKRGTEPFDNPWTDPRGRVWTATPDVSTFVHPIDDPGRAAVPGDICPAGWEVSFDRSEIATQAIVGRELPDDVPVLRWNLGGATSPPPGVTFLDMNSGDQKAVTVIRPNATALNGVNAEPFLRNLIANSVIKLTDVGDVTNNTRTYRVTGTAVRQTGATGTYYDVPVVWTDGETGIGGVIEAALTIVEPSAIVRNDTTGQTLYGIETRELLDLICIDDTPLVTVADRILASQGYTTMPRIAAVTLEAAAGDLATMELMATCFPFIPSRYRCRLQTNGRLVFDRMMFATGTRHFMSHNSWSLRITLDDAQWASQ